MKLYHLSFDVEPSLSKMFVPRVPTFMLDGENNDIPRVCFSKSILGCINAMPDISKYLEDYSYGMGSSVGVLYSVDLDDISLESFVDSDELYEHGLVPDAIINQECWCLEPVTMMGEIVELRPLSENRNDFLYCAKEHNRDFIYSVIDSVCCNYASLNKEELDQYSLFYLMNAFFYKFSYELGCDLSREFHRLSKAPGTAGLIDGCDVYSAFMVNGEMLTLRFDNRKFRDSFEMIKEDFMSNMKVGYNERALGNSCVVEKLPQGFYRVVCEDGRNDTVRAVGEQQLHVGDVGRTVYYGDSRTYGLVRFDKDPAVEFDFEKAKKNYPYGWKETWPSGLSKEAEALYKVFKERYVENGYMYSGMIPLNAAPICSFGVNHLYELVSADVLQKRDCDGDAFELTTQERLKLIREYNLQDVWKEHGLAEWCDDEISRVLNGTCESSLEDKLDDAIGRSGSNNGRVEQVIGRGHSETKVWDCL